MKLQQIIVIGYLSVMVAGCSTAHTYCRNSSNLSRCETECQTISNCECADPSCSYHGNSCLDGIKCCGVFGNLGGKRDDSSDSADGYRYERYDEAEAYFSNYVNGDVTPAANASYEAAPPAKSAVRSYKGENFKGQ